MSSMVASITSPIDTLLQGATRARAPGRTCTAVPMLPCKPISRCDLRETKLAPNTRWGSRSRDPIEYVGGQDQLYRYGNSTPHIETDSLGLCVDCQKRGGKKLERVATLVDEIIDYEMDAFFKRWKAPNERHDPDIDEIERYETPKPNPRRLIWVAYHQRRYKVTCCEESDGTVTLEKLEEQELKPRSSEYANASFSVPLPWALTEATKEAYVKFVHPVPYWQYGRDNDNWGKCLAATGFTNLGTRLIKRDSEIEGGIKE